MVIHITKTNIMRNINLHAVTGISLHAVNPSAHPSYSHYYLLSPSTLFFFFCTSYCFLHILLFCTFFYFIAHFTLISLFLTICMPLCYVTLYNLYSYYFALSTERTWFDYISLLIIPCITYYGTNKETLNLGWCAFVMSPCIHLVSAEANFKKS